MVHSGILPHHPRWAKLFENLRYVDHRRAARLSRRLRQPPLQRAAAAAADLPALRVEPGVSLLVGDDRQPARARRAADRTAVRARGRERRAARREVLRVREPAGRQPSARHPAFVSERDAAHRVGVPEAEPAADRVRAEPPVDRDPDDLPEGRFRGRCPGAPERIRGYRGGYLPTAPPRDRKRAARGRGARGRVHQRARARHRHRRARRRGDGRLSGHDRGDVAARRARGAPGGPVGGGHGGEQRAARSVRRPQPVVFLRRVARAGADRSRQPAHPRRPHQVRGLRAAVHRTRSVRPPRPAGDPRHARRAGARAPDRRRADDPDEPPTDAAQWTWTNESYPADAVSLRSVSSDNFVDRRHDRRARVSSARPISRAARPRSTRRRSTSSKARCIRWSGSTSRGARRSCARSTATTTRRDHVHEGDDRSTRSRAVAAPSPRSTRSGARRLRVARRSPRRLARRRLQEDQVLHQRERRIGRAGSARTADAHDVVLADDSGGGDGACCRTRPTIGATASSVWRSRCSRSRSCC